ncbi:hypothetical protein BDZ97DRAFT_1756581 [Flammula alnicola]|nr:hypothetical protein BDZ97DRAFT_1756581 [Flammula alnicola]
MREKLEDPTRYMEKPPAYTVTDHRSTSGSDSVITIYSYIPNTEAITADACSWFYYALGGKIRPIFLFCPLCPAALTNSFGGLNSGLYLVAGTVLGIMQSGSS